ncbi:hypothetical protein [Streptomyces acidiscabies]|uniref:Uncharacterized protein n=1 Tax=Streptomyces acidiscabies TaxID=42234 RepID=A0AAP6BCR0_9ACTN|nr:hypothetical protein [Streptomyces acidiscabies]MBP5938456.1 hypothetical protein [Streptomyces sp. LBUM 1476]MBZ3909558.1 hypothetical protein [Streptomyces acidiscabies]MDX2962274.1 hypothetical protein [Streptomyces acidiscabies]MDX3019726.1 hypothetical protein [Streptomyces acidiscabies]MDX3792293.1 hypothetical protein [Streptomyces acidiscabies]
MTVEGSYGRTGGEGDGGTGEGSRGMTLTWQRAADEQWAAAVEARLLLNPQVPEDLPARVLAEAHEAVTDSGRTATDLFGDPHDYARTVTEERVDDTHRAGRDAQGMTPTDRLRTYLATLGGVGVFLGVAAWLDEGFWLHPSWSSLTASGTVLGVVVLLIIAMAMRAAGRRTRGFGAGALAVFAGGVTASTLLPEEPSFALPALTLTATGLALSIAALTLPVPDRWFAPRPGDWPTHLEALLRTRHAMPRAEARAHVEEARRHLDGGVPEEVFGPADVYALQLADGPRRTRRLAHRERNATTAFTVLAVAFSWDELHPSSSMFWVYVAGLTCLVGYTALMWLRPDRT